MSSSAASRVSTITGLQSLLDSHRTLEQFQLLRESLKPVWDEIFRSIYHDELQVFIEENEDKIPEEGFTGVSSIDAKMIETIGETEWLLYKLLKMDIFMNETTF